MTRKTMPLGSALHSTISRRRFLTNGSLALCAAGLAMPWSAAAATPGTLTASRFLPLIDTAFSGRTLSSPAAPPLMLWLRTVEPLAHGNANAVDSRAAERSFVLSFAVEGTTATQDTYALTHARLGSFAALLVPSRNARTLTAVFNRSV
jgi:hypothetical protein